MSSGMKAVMKGHRFHSANEAKEATIVAYTEGTRNGLQDYF
jgi:hypothetical protein